MLTFFIVLFVFIMQFMWRYIDELVGARARHGRDYGG